MTSGWQPIETAPKDGTRFLAWSRMDGMVTAIFHSHYKECRLDPDGGTEFEYEFYQQPSHWMPLPPPPTETDQ